MEKLSAYTIAANCTDITDCNDGISELWDASDRYKKAGRKAPEYIYKRIEKLEAKRDKCSLKEHGMKYDEWLLSRFDKLEGASDGYIEAYKEALKKWLKYQNYKGDKRNTVYHILRDNADSAREFLWQTPDGLPNIIKIGDWHFDEDITDYDTMAERIFGGLHGTKKAKRPTNEGKYIDDERHKFFMRLITKGRVKVEAAQELSLMLVNAMVEFGQWKNRQYESPENTTDRLKAHEILCRITDKLLDKRIIAKADAALAIGDMIRDCLLDFAKWKDNQHDKGLQGTKKADTMSLEGLDGRRVYGGNSGYQGYSKSNRAVDAEKRGLRSKSQMDNDFADKVNELIKAENPAAKKVTLAQIKKHLDNITADEWHHTSKFGNRTNYYSVERVATHFIDNIKIANATPISFVAKEDIDKILDYLQDSTCNDGKGRYLASNGVVVDVHRGEPPFSRAYNEGSVETRYISRYVEPYELDEPQRSMLVDALAEANNRRKMIVEAERTKSLFNESAAYERVRAAIVGGGLGNTNDYDSINAVFNAKLQQQIDGVLQENYIYTLGLPSEYLLSTGFPNIPIELSARQLDVKHKFSRHPFEFADVRNLVTAIQKPMAIFKYGDKEKAQNLIVDLKRGDKYFLVGVHFNYEKTPTVTVSNIRGLFPKDNAEWFNWVTQDKLLRVDEKEKIQTLIDIQGMTFSEPTYLDLDSVANIIKNFKNPPLPSKKNNTTDQSAPLSGSDIPLNERRLKLLKLKAKAIKMKLELLKIDDEEAPAPEYKVGDSFTIHGDQLRVDSIDFYKGGFMYVLLDPKKGQKQGRLLLTESELKKEATQEWLQIAADHIKKLAADKRYKGLTSTTDGNTMKILSADDVIGSLEANINKWGTIFIHFVGRNSHDCYINSCADKYFKQELIDTTDTLVEHALYPDTNDRSAEFAEQMAKIVNRLAETDEHKGKNLRVGISDYDFAGRPSKKVVIRCKGSKSGNVCIYHQPECYSEDYTLMCEAGTSGRGTGFNSKKDNIEEKLQDSVEWVIKGIGGKLWKQAQQQK